MARIRADWYERRGISKERYNELIWFARQYDQLKAAQRRWIAAEYDRIAVNASARARTDRTVSEAICGERFPQAWKIAAIEQAALAADAAIYDCILRNVTRDVRYEDMAVCAGRRQFFMARRRFFEELHVRLEKSGH